MTEDELQAALDKSLPPEGRHGLFVEECQDQDVRLRFSPANISTATLLALAEIALRAAAGADAALTHLSVTMLRAAQPADVVSLSRVIRRDGAIVHAEAWLFSHAVIEPVLHATATLRR
ncbi:MAG TPA: hypothetical protein VEC14_16240 [Reyranellaceae bacterium]|nr:hypothetical protein [Reyranellaceae bacterium]